MIEKTCANYWKHLINDFWDRQTRILESDCSSDEEAEALYSIGYNFFSCGKYDAAENVFQRLTVYAPYSNQYWRALGAVKQQKRDYKDAIAAYDMAIANDERDVISYVYRAESKILSEHIEEGLQDLQMVEKIGKENTQSMPWVDRARLIIKCHKQA
jgi:type III secretion system low calcium response chaperone LcrH/SycD